MHITASINSAKAIAIKKVRQTSFVRLRQSRGNQPLVFLLHRPPLRRIRTERGGGGNALLRLAERARAVVERTVQQGKHHHAITREARGRRPGKRAEKV